MPAPLAQLLASSTFPEAEARRLIDDADADARRRLLAGVRAESEGRFVEAAQAILENVDWKAPDPSIPGAWLELLGARSFRQGGLRETACDHLSCTDVAVLARLCAKPDAAFGLAVLRAIELGDEKAIAEVRARVAKGPPNASVHNPESDPIGARRYARIVQDRFGASDEERIRKAPTAWGYGALPSWIAAQVAEARGVALEEQPPHLQFASSPSSRVLLRVAAAISKEAGEELLVAIANEKFLHDRRIGTFELAWDEAHEICENQQLFLACRFGKTVFTAYTPLEANGVPVPWKNVRIAAKAFPDEAKAKKEIAKKLAEQEKKLGGKAALRRPAGSVAEKDEALVACIRADTSAERVIDLLAGGAKPDAFATDDGWGALHWAVRTDSEIVRRLVVAGADASRKTVHGLMPLDLIADSSDGDSLRATELLVAAGGRCGPTALASASGRGLHRKIPLLAKAGGDAAAAHDGKTAHEAALDGKFPRTAAAIRALQ